jgi:DNA replication ATP-dependent helicase Dna2
MLLSFGCDSDTGHAKAFLGDPRRINVAVTRARSRFYCLASKRLVQSSLAEQGELAAIFKWCRNPGSRVAAA